MPDGRLDDLERRIRELEARVAGLHEEQASLEDAVAAVGGRPAETDEEHGRDTEAWADPPIESQGRAEGGGAGSDGVGGSGTESDEREVVMAPPSGATQAAVEQAVDEVERPTDREENLVM